jgi:type IV secretion system protein VirB1
MTALAPAAFAALLSQCAPDAPPGYVTDLARAESRLEPYAIHDNAANVSVYPQTLEQALPMAREMLRLGHSVDLGLMQVNSANFRWLGLTAETALDPCTNVRAGASVLQAFSRYNTGSPIRGFQNGYVTRVVSVGRTAVPDSVPATQQPQQEAPAEPFDLGSGDDTALTTTYEKGN